MIKRGPESDSLKLRRHDFAAQKVNSCSTIGVMWWSVVPRACGGVRVEKRRELEDNGGAGKEKAK